MNTIVHYPVRLGLGRVWARWRLLVEETVYKSSNRNVSESDVVNNNNINNNNNSGVCKFIPNEITSNKFPILMQPCSARTREVILFQPHKS